MCLKKLFVLAMTAVFMLSVAVIVPSAEGAQTVLPLQNANNSTFFRGGKSGDKIVATDSASNQAIMRADFTAGDDRRMAMLRFDLKDYLAEIQGAESLKLRLSVVTEKNGIDPQNQFAVYLMPQETEGWIRQQATYNIMNGPGNDVVGFTSDLLYTSPDNLQADQPYETEDILPKIKAHLAATPGDTVVSFKIDGVAGGSMRLHAFTTGDNEQYRPALVITDPAEPPAGQAAIDQAKANLTLATITKQDAGAVTDDLYLPTAGVYGTTIEWSSTNEAAVNSATGAVTCLDDSKQEVTLTAKLTNDGVEESLTFPITIPAVKQVIGTKSNFIRKDQADNVMSTDNVLLQIDTRAATNRMGYVMFNLGENAEQILQDATSVRLRLTPFQSGGNMRKMAAVTVSLLSQDQKAANWGQMTYNRAADRNLLDAGELLYISEPVISVPAGQNEGDDIYTDDLLPAIRKQLRETPGDKTVVFRVASSLGTDFQLLGPGWSNDKTRASLMVTQRTDDLDAAAAVRETKDALTFDRLTTDPLDSVTSNLYLPATGVNGTTITWESSSDKLNAATGMIKRPTGGNESVTLTAHLTNGAENDAVVFNLTIAKSIQLKVDQTAWVRKDSANNMSNTDSNSVVVNAYPSVSESIAFMRFDLKDYMDVIENEAAKVQLKLSTFNDGAKDASNQFAVYQMREDQEDFYWKGMTFNNAKNVWPDMVSYREDLCYVSPLGLRNNADYITVDLLPLIRQHLKENPGDTVVSYRIEGIQGAGFFLIGKADFAGDDHARLEITLDTDAPLSAAEAVAKTKASLSLASLTKEPADKITSGLYLPRSGPDGTSITWSSTNAAVVDPDTGAVVPPADTAKKVTLTAAIKNGSSEDSVTIPITVPSEAVLSLANDAAVISAAEPDSVVSKDQLAAEPMYATTGKTSYFRFDLTADQRDELLAADTLRLRVATTAGSAGDFNQFGVYLVDENKEDWDSALLTYRNAGELLNVSSSANCLVTGYPLQENTAYYSGNILPLIEAHLKANPDDTRLSFAVVGLTGEAVTLAGAGAENSLKPALVIGTGFQAVSVTGAAKDGMKISANVNFNQALSGTAEIFAASYDAQGRLVEIKSKKVTDPAEGTVTPCEFTFAAGTTFRLYVWKEDSLVPLTRTKTII